MNKKDQNRVKKIIQKLASLQEQVENLYGEIGELSEELRNRYEEESRYYDDAEIDADTLDDIYDSDYDNVYDSIDNTIECLNDMLDEAVVIERISKKTESPAEKRYSMLRKAEEMTLNQIESKKGALDEKQYKLNIAKVKTAIALYSQLVEGGASEVETYNEQVEKMEKIYFEMGGDEAKWSKNVTKHYISKGF